MGTQYPFKRVNGKTILGDYDNGNYIQFDDKRNIETQD